MRTPREILLGRHRSATPKLDRIRQEWVAKMDTASYAALAWRELIWPVRRAWLGLGVAWGVILILRLIGGSEPAAIAIHSASVSPDSVYALQKRELMAQSPQADSPAPPSIRNSPRSEVKLKFKPA